VLQFFLCLFFEAFQSSLSTHRYACGNGSASVLLEDSGVVLRVGSAPGTLTLALPRLGDPEGREVLRDLLFKMADSLSHLDSTASVSPAKSQQRGYAERGLQLESRLMTVMTSEHRNEEENRC
ncbi:hypothetical protein Z043_111908, partial [Scleropages formosus]